MDGLFLFYFGGGGGINIGYEMKCVDNEMIYVIELFIRFFSRFWRNGFLKVID